jgi:hypothetical protein
MEHGDIMSTSISGCCAIGRGGQHISASTDMEGSCLTVNENGARTLHQRDYGMKWKDWAVVKRESKVADSEARTQNWDF